MKNIFSYVFIVVAFFIVILVGINILSVRKDISLNNSVIQTLVEKEAENKKSIRELRAKINKIVDDDRTVEKVLIKKFKMLRKDQFIINDKNI